MFVILVGTAVAAGQEPDWTVVSARGTALVLQGRQWQIVSPGDSLANGPILRTLRNGSMSIRSPLGEMSLDGDTAIAMDGMLDGTVLVREYSGRVTVKADGGAGTRYLVLTPTASVNVDGSVVQVSISNRRTLVHVTSGTAIVVSDSGRQVVQLAEGQNLSTAANSAIGGGNGAVVSASGANANAGGRSGADGTNGASSANSNASNGANSSAGNGTGSGSSNGNGPGSSNAGGNSNGSGNANAGGNSNGSGSSNAGGNSNGSGNSNAGGNSSGNSNSSGSGNSNAGGSGNGSSHGNGASSSNASSTGSTNGAGHNKT